MKSGGIESPDPAFRFHQGRFQRQRSFDHGVGAMGDQYMAGVACRDDLVNSLSVLVSEMQAVFAHQGLDFKIKANLHVLEDLPDLRVANLVIAHVIEIDFIDGAARGDDQQFVHDFCPVDGI